MRNYYKMKTSGLRRLLGSVLAVVAILTAGTGVAQTSFRVSGKITDAQGASIPGAMVVVKSDSSRGSLAAADGTYNIDAPSPNAVLVFTMLGYRPQEIAIASRAVIDVQMAEDATLVDEVVVVGYGTVKREFVIGSVSQVSAKDLVKAPAANVSNLLVGKLPGFTTVQRSGQPGQDYAEFYIRGEADGLVLVDGVERSINSVNPRDVESVTVLKDAATASIYGIRGANGVVLITTKMGSERPAEITYNGSVLFARNTAFPELLNAQDYIAWHNLASQMDNQAPKWTDNAIQSMKDAGVYGETDWMDLLYKPFGLEHQHNLSASGGTERVKYYTSLGMYDQQGIIPNSSYKRFNIRTNLDVKVAKNLNFAVNLAGYHSQIHKPGYNLDPQGVSNPLQQAMYALPIIAPTYTDPRNGDVYPLGYVIGSTVQSPVAAIQESGYNNTSSWKFEGNARLEYAFDNTSVLRGLKFGVHGSYDVGFTSLRSYMSPYNVIGVSLGSPESIRVDFDNPNASDVKIISPGDLGTTQSFSRSPSMSTRTMLRPQISYEREFGKHAVSGLFLYEQIQDFDETMTGRRKGYVANYPVDISTGNNVDGYDNNTIVSGSFKNRAIASFVGRLNYAYDRKYLLELSFRADATWKFDPANQWGYFPSVKVGWVISEENFFKNAATPINFLKIRATYGESGRDFPDGYAYMFVRTFKSSNVWYSPEEPSSTNYIFGDKGESAFRVANYLHHGLTWAHIRNYNIGFDSEMWDGKLGVDFDWFYKIEDRMLSNIDGTFSPSLGGNNPVLENYGKTDIRGFELTLRHRNQFAGGWRYSLEGTLSWYRRRVLRQRLSDNVPTNYHAPLGKPGGWQQTWLYGFKATGLFQTPEQLDQAPMPPSGNELRLGDIMYADINGDGKLNEQDHVKIGNSITPEMMFNLDMNVAWKGLSLYAQWQGAAIASYSLSGNYNHNVIDNTIFTRPFYETGNAPYYMVENAWREDHRDATMPRLSTKPSNNNANYSSWWVKDGSYLRLKTLTLAYNLPARYLENTFISGVNVYLSARNLFTISGFKYVDPEMPSVNNGYYPQQKTFSVGVDLTF